MPQQTIQYSEYASTAAHILQTLGVALPPLEAAGPHLFIHSPIDGQRLALLQCTTVAQTRQQVAQAQQAQAAWQHVPAPQRGAVVRVLGDLVRQHKAALAELISLEVGKIRSESLGEVQEVIDMCDFAQGLSRQLYGLTMPSERPEHQLRETWHPLGVVGIITAFNFPMAVWAWNAALALVCGNALVWKPSEKTPLCALALHQLLQQALQAEGHAPAISSVVLGHADVGQALVEAPAVRLVSATGSTPMGRVVGQACAQRFKRSLLELGGNNAAVVCASADVALALRAVVFAAVGTAGQRCTTLRRLFIHRSLYADFVQRLQAVYEHLPVGNPLAADTLVGPLIDSLALESMQVALLEAQALGAQVYGGEVLSHGRGSYVDPALVEMPSHSGPMLRETFAPILYVLSFDTLAEAIALVNASEHGLSASIFTHDLREAELFCSAAGAECGIVNVNIGTSGAEIGGAFGGEKATGGGREAGSDSWKAYMRRTTNTINYGHSLPLAQGVRFEV